VRVVRRDEPRDGAAAVVRQERVAPKAEPIDRAAHRRRMRGQFDRAAGLALPGAGKVERINEPLDDV